MIKYSEQLAGHRDLLIARCAEQRNALAVQKRTLVEKLSVFEIGVSVFDRFKKNPAWIAGLVVGLVVIKPRRLLPILETGLLTWQAVRTLLPALTKHLGTPN